MADAKRFRGAHPARRGPSSGGRPPGREGSRARRGSAEHRGQSHLQGPHLGSRRYPRGASQGRGRHRDREDQRPGVRSHRRHQEPGLRGHPLSLEPGAHTGRIERGIRGGHGGVCLSPGDGQRRRRLDPDPRQLHRDLRTQALLRTGTAGTDRALGLRRHLLLRTAHQDGRGRGTVSGPGRRPLALRSEHAAGARSLLRRRPRGGASLRAADRLLPGSRLRSGAR